MMERLRKHMEERCALGRSNRRRGGEGTGGESGDEDGTGGMLQMLPDRWDRTMSPATVYERHTH